MPECAAAAGPRRSLSLCNHGRLAVALRLVSHGPPAALGRRRRLPCVSSTVLQFEMLPQQFGLPFVEPFPLRDGYAVRPSVMSSSLNE